MSPLTDLTDLTDLTGLTAKFGGPAGKNDIRTSEISGRMPKNRASRPSSPSSPSSRFDLRARRSKLDELDGLDGPLRAGAGRRGLDEHQRAGSCRSPGGLGAASA